MSILLQGKDIINQCTTFFTRMRLQGHCCDAVLGTEDGGMFRVHKTIMSCCSTYFRTLFRTSLGGRHCGDGDASRTFIVIPNVSADILENIIEFAYSGEILINGENVDYLFSAADQFNITGIVEACTEYILKNLSPENCLGVWKFGKYYSLFPFESKAFEYSLENFPNIIKTSSEFLLLTVDELKAILQENYLNAESELVVWKAIKRWIELGPPSRVKYLSKLFQFVRLPVSPVLDIHVIVNELFLSKNIEYFPIVYQVLKGTLQKMKLYRKNAAQFEEELVQFTPRYPREVLFCCGGIYPGDDGTVFEVYDSRADVWKQVNRHDAVLHRRFFQSVSLNEYIYFIGGTEGNRHVNSCYRFDSLKGFFEEIAPMYQLRSYHCSAKHNGNIYVFGGLDGFSRLNTAECYTPKTNQWSYIEPMHTKRSDASACNVRNRIFIVGGFDGCNYLSSAEVYDIEVDQWFMLPDMLTPRASLGCVALNDCIYAVGGNEHGTNLETVEKFSLLHEQWFVGKSMKLSRSNFGIQVMENKIYVVGGFGGFNDHQSKEVEVYDSAICQWKRIAALKCDRSGFDICVLSHLKNIEEYILDNSERQKLFNKFEGTCILEEIVELDDVES